MLGVVSGLLPRAGGVAAPTGCWWRVIHPDLSLRGRGGRGRARAVRHSKGRVPGSPAGCSARPECELGAGGFYTESRTGVFVQTAEDCSDWGLLQTAPLLCVPAYMD